jgi:hypothetical protein
MKILSRRLPTDTEEKHEKDVWITDLRIEVWITELPVTKQEEYPIHFCHKLSFYLRLLIIEIGTEGGGCRRKTDRKLGSTGGKEEPGAKMIQVTISLWSKEITLKPPAGSLLTTKLQLQWKPSLDTPPPTTPAVGSGGPGRKLQITLQQSMKTQICRFWTCIHDTGHGKRTHPTDGV